MEALEDTGRESDGELETPTTEEAQEIAEEQGDSCKAVTFAAQYVSWLATIFIQLLQPNCGLVQGYMHWPYPYLQYMLLITYLKSVNTIIVLCYTTPPLKNMSHIHDLT